MRKLVYTAFIAFWTCVGTVAALYAVSGDKPRADRAESPVYTLEDLAEHDSLDNCWMAIDGMVYDFTGYIPEHPAPPSVLERWCGREATEGMRTKGYGAGHSRRAWMLMEDYQIGKLAEKG